MIFQFLLHSLYVGARDQDIREAKAQTEIEQGSLTKEQAAEKYNVSTSALDQRIRTKARRSQSYTGDKRRQRAFITQKTLGNIKEIRKNVYSLRTPTGVRVIDATTNEGQQRFSQALLETSQPTAIRQTVKRSKLPLKLQVASDLFKRSGFSTRIKKGVIEAEKKGTKIFLSRQGDVITNSRTAKIDFKSFNTLNQGQKKAYLNSLINKTPTQLKQEGFKIKEEKNQIYAVRGKTIIKFNQPEKQKKVTGTLTATEQKKSLSERIRDIQLQQRYKTLKSKGAEKIIRGTVIAGGIGALSGVVNVLSIPLNPVKFAKDLYTQVRYPIKTVKAVGQEFTVDPAGVLAEFYTYNKALNTAGRLGKRSPVGRYVSEELFIRSQPKQIQSSVRAIIKSAKVQENINPFQVKKIKKVDFIEVKELTKIEATALQKAFKKTDSVVFGSLAARTLSKKKTPLPKDVDLATKNVALFNKEFIKALPKEKRKNYVVSRQKIYRKTRSGKTPILDVKPINRLIPQRSLISGKGRLPVVGYVKRIGLSSGLPVLKSKRVAGQFTIPTQKIIKVGGIKLVGFGEQTTRKALGTLQVLIEKNSKRAKDPQSFLISLKVQLEALKRNKPSNIISGYSQKRKIKILSDTIRLLESKEFARLLESKVKGLTKEYPLVAKINPKKIRKINKSKVRKEVKKRLNNVLKNTQKKKVIKKNIKRKKSIKRKRSTKKRVSKKQSSRLSKLPKSKLTKSKIPPSKLKKVPSRLSKLPSNLKRPNNISQLRKGISKLTRVPISRIPSTIPRLSKLITPNPRTSKLPISKLPNAKITKRYIQAYLNNQKQNKKFYKAEDIKRNDKKVLGKALKGRNFVYVADLVSRLEGRKASKTQKRALLKKGRIFSGLESRKLVG